MKTQTVPKIRRPKVKPSTTLVVSQAPRCDLCGHDGVLLRHDLSDHFILICNRCGFVFKSSVTGTKPDEVYGIYKTEWYWNENPNLEGQVAAYDASVSDRISIYERELAELNLALNGPGRLLDVGCGRGVFLDMARKRGWTTQGVDISPQARDYASLHFGQEVLTTTLQEAGFAPRTFDVVSLWDVIEHLTSPTEAVAEARRILKPGGILLIMTVDEDALLPRLVRALASISAGRAAPLVNRLYGGGHVSFFSERSIRHLLSQHGFRPARIVRESIDAGKWRKPTSIERLAGIVDTGIGGPLGMQYRMIVHASKQV